MKNKDICLCIVLYKCQLTDCLTYKTLITFTKSVLYVYDNSPFSQVIIRPNTIYVHDAKNSGLSVAYNSAAKYAKENGFKWLLLLDQDTDFSGILFDDFVNSIETTPNIKLFAPKVKCGEKYMSPVKTWHRMGVLQKTAPEGIISLSDYSIINSGMCINVDAMIECGGYNEKVFLDQSDFEFLEKFKRLHPVAFIIGKDIKQQLSVFSDNNNSVIGRYRLYCKSVKGCEKKTFFEPFWLFILVLKRGLSICIRRKTLQPIKIFLSEYIRS